MFTGSFFIDSNVIYGSNMWIATFFSVLYYTSFLFYLAVQEKKKSKT